MKRPFLGYQLTPIRTCLLIMTAPIGYLALIILYANIAADRISYPVFVNHSGQELTIQVGRTSVHLPKGEILEVKGNWWEGVTIETKKGERWQYQWQPLSYRPYVVHDRTYLQVEPDGGIYVLPFRAQGPVDDLPSQPVGYPLHPVAPG